MLLIYNCKLYNYKHHLKNVNLFYLSQFTNALHYCLNKIRKFKNVKMQGRKFSLIAQEKVTLLTCRI